MLICHLFKKIFKGKFAIINDFIKDHVSVLTVQLKHQED